jgi:hypothetical protein
LAPKALTQHGILTFKEKLTSQPGLPDFSWYSKPKREKIYQTGHKNTKCNKIYQNSHKNTKCHKRYQKYPSKGLPKCTKFGIFGMKIYIPSGNPDLNGFNVSHLRELPMQLKAVHVWIKKNPLRRKKISVALHQCDQICLRLNGPKT